MAGKRRLVITMDLIDPHGNVDLSTVRMADVMATHLSAVLGGALPAGLRGQIVSVLWDGPVDENKASSAGDDHTTVISGGVLDSEHLRG